jgi:hypothetical protein
MSAERTVVGSISNLNIRNAILQDASLETIRDLLEAIDDVNKPDHLNNTILHYAVQKNREDVVCLLASRGVNPNLCNQGGGGVTPLHVAVSKGYGSMARLLVAIGADVNAAPGSYRDTALHLAVAAGDKGMVRLLVDELGADVHARDACGRTAFRRAIVDGSKDMVGQLVGLGVEYIKFHPHWSASKEMKAFMKECSTRVKAIKSYAESKGAPSNLKRVCAYLVRNCFDLDTLTSSQIATVVGHKVSQDKFLFRKTAEKKAHDALSVVLSAELDGQEKTEESECRIATESESTQAQRVEVSVHTPLLSSITCVVPKMERVVASKGGPFETSDHGGLYTGWLDTVSNSRGGGSAGRC